MCGVCNTPIKVHTKKTSTIYKCPDCKGKIIVDNERVPTVTTAKCKCGTLVILESKEETSFYPAKK